MSVYSYGERKREREKSARKKTWVCIRCAWVTIALFHLCNLSLFLLPSSSSSSNVPDDNVLVCHELIASHPSFYFSTFFPLLILPSFTTFSLSLSFSTRRVTFHESLLHLSSLSFTLSTRRSNDKFQVKITLNDCKRFTLDWMWDHLTMRVEWRRERRQNHRKERRSKSSERKWCEWIFASYSFSLVFRLHFHQDSEDGDVST